MTDRSSLFTPFRLGRLRLAQPVRDAGDAARDVREWQPQARAGRLLCAAGGRGRAADHRRKRGGRSSVRDRAAELGTSQRSHRRSVGALRRRGARGGRADAAAVVARRRIANRRQRTQSLGPRPSGQGQRPGHDARGNAGDRRRLRALGTYRPRHRRRRGRSALRAWLPARPVPVARLERARGRLRRAGRRRPGALPRRDRPRDPRRMRA